MISKQKQNLLEANTEWPSGGEVSASDCDAASREFDSRFSQPLLGIDKLLTKLAWELTPRAFR